MKTRIISLYILFIGTLLSCNESYIDSISGGDINITEALHEGDFNAEITNFTANSILHGITIFWDEPENSDLNSYQIEWKGSVLDKVIYSKVVKKGVTELLIDRLFNEDYEITVKCISKDLLYSNGVQITKSPIKDFSPPENISNLTIQSMAISADLSWNNQDNNSYDKIVIEILDVENNILEEPVVLSSTKENYQLRGLSETTVYKLSVYTESYLGYKSEIEEIIFKTGASAKIIEGEGKVNDTDIRVNILGGSCTSVAQEPDIFENTYDQNLETMYHSQWSLGGSGHPEHRPSFEYVFSEPSDIDYILYYERKSGSNGRIQAMNISVMTATSDSKFIELGNFNNIVTSGEVKRITLPITTDILKVKFDVVKSANNDVAIQEVEFYKSINQ